ncbi:glycosyltransferase [Variovorax sp. J22P271]|uniref:glycosyltransferase n=1 Tax=Variovorax davisae TaxID=3053515 RepID=UPI002577E758|nr:glycosyltransferase [Variovorax sp. J22P271]MDM0032137.1 glycosyltransferase [Variovorax sp. J22P271]
MLGVVVPAHNEEAFIGDCIRHLRRCAQSVRLRGEPVEILVVADTCTDRTAEIVARAGVMTLAIDVRNVGKSRAAGASLLLERGARWLAFTDADTLVSPEWLAEQLDLAADVVCGTVGISDWSPHGAHARLLHWHFSETYFDVDGHRHIHGANLGVEANAYRRAGGFEHLECGEDVALVEALDAVGAKIAWSARPRVITSARKKARASGGFADALTNAVKQRLRAGATVPGHFVLEKL